MTSSYDTIGHLLNRTDRSGTMPEGGDSPLAPSSAAGNVWMAWQYDRSEKGEGLVQAFRRAGSAKESMRLKRRELQPDATYAVANLGTAETAETTGRELIENGLEISLKEKPGSVPITYKKKM